VFKSGCLPAFLRALRAIKILTKHVVVVSDSSKSFKKRSDRQPIAADSVLAIMGAGR